MQVSEDSQAGPGSELLFGAAVEALHSYSYGEMLINMLLAVVLGFMLTGVYRHTHKGLSYSQSFALTILFVTVIVAIVMMVIGNSLARAFALVGALSIIRFRTVIKDTKDTAYVFAGLALGMAAGTANYFLAVTAALLISVLALATHKFNYASLVKSEYIVRFMVTGTAEQAQYQQVLNACAQRVQLLQIEPTGDSNMVIMSFDIKLRDDVRPETLSAELCKLQSVSELVLIGASTDVDY